MRACVCVFVCLFACVFIVVVFLTGFKEAEPDVLPVEEDTLPFRHVRMELFEAINNDRSEAGCVHWLLLLSCAAA